MAEAKDKNASTGFAILDGMSNLSVLKQVGLMVGLAASIALGFWVVLWSQEPDYRPLFTDVSNLDASQVANVLQRENIRFKVDTDSGMIMVESDKINQARLKLAAEGLPTGDTMGYALLDKQEPFGTSQFMEKTRYYRSVEGELAKTISSMNRVRGARVHLAIPKRSVFINDNRKPSASVFVELYPGQSLDRMQVAAIVQLVASSIPELNEKQVTVVDQRGQLLTNNDGDTDLVVAARQFEYTKKIEDQYISRISNILDPIVGPNGYKVQVNADLDFNKTEQTSEYFNPDSSAVRSEQTLNEVVGGNGSAGGIPGALSNQPPGAVTVPQTTNANNANAANGTQQTKTSSSNGNVREEATRNFELDRTISHTRHQVGAIKRLTVAVVLDDKTVPAAATGANTGTAAGANATAPAAPKRVPISDAEMQRIRQLVQDAIGFNALNPHHIWIVVILVMAVGGIGHIATRALGARFGLPLAGFAGGFISSTVTIGSMGERARRMPQVMAAATAGAVLSTVATMVELTLLIGATSLAGLQALAIPFGCAAIAAVGYGIAFTLPALRQPPATEPQPGHAFHPGTALLFALLLSAILLASAALHAWLGDAGLLAGTMAAGFVDVQAPAVSAVSLSIGNGSGPAAAVLPVLAAFTTNTVSKIVFAITGGGRAFALRVVPGLVLVALAAWASMLLPSPP